MHDPQGRLIGYAIGGVVFLTILAFRMRRAAQSRPFRLQYVWVLPVLFLILSLLTLVSLPPQGMEWLWLALILLAGLAAGWVNGATIHLEVDPATRAMRAKASPAAMIFVVGLVLVRFGMRAALSEGASSFHLRPALIQNGFLMLALGLFLTRSLEMGLRARRLRRQAVAEVFA